MPSKAIIKSWQKRLMMIEKQEREWNKMLSAPATAEFAELAQRNIKRLAESKASLQREIDEVKQEEAE